jgi:hypothetical protein
MEIYFKDVLEGSWYKEACTDLDKLNLVIVSQFYARFIFCC